MALTFRYKSLPRPGESSCKTPIVPIRIKGKKRSIRISAILDSGADYTLISKDVAKLIGLDLSGKKDTSLGIGGDVPTVESKAIITIGKNREKYTFRIPVLVLMTNQSMEPLLGRKGFFDKFKIVFEEKNSKVQLKRMKKR